LAAGSPGRGQAPAEARYKGKPAGHGIKKLEDADATARREAVVALAALGPKAEAAVPALLKALTDSDEEVRPGAIRALGRIGPAAAKAALPALTGLLADRDPDYRQAAILSLADLGREAQPVLPDLLQLYRAENNAGIRAAICVAWGKIGTEDKEVLARLVEALKDYRYVSNLPSDPRGIPGTVRKAASNALTALGPAALPAVFDLLQGSDLNLASDALGILADMGPEVLPRLIEKASDDQSKVRAACLRALGKMRPLPGEAIPVLLDALGDGTVVEVKSGPAAGRHPAIALAARDALKDMRGAALPALFEALHSQDNQVRTRAREALDAMLQERRFSTVPPELAPLLADMLSSSDAALREPAQVWLVRMGSPAIPALAAVLARRDEEAVGKTLKEMGPAAGLAVPELTRLLGNPDAAVRRRAAQVLGQLGPSAKSAVNALADALKDQDEPVRRAALEALQKIQAKP
jgi:HEAT repeat protein